MKPTAVEFAVEQLEQLIPFGHQLAIRIILEQALEMEKQQQGYSEKEVIAFGEFIFKHSLLTHAKGVKSLFEQFKKK